MLLEYEEQSLFRMSLFYIIMLRIPIYINFIFTAEVLFQEMFSIYYFLQTPARYIALIFFYFLNRYLH
jgi:hypothetical protein